MDRSNSWKNDNCRVTILFLLPQEKIEWSMPRPINRDPSRPRGRMSQYAFFVQDRREMYRRQGVKVGFSEFSRECATLWKAMSPEQRVGYQQLAEHDKVRYRNEIDRYRGRVSTVSGVKKRGRKKKQPGEPKRNM